MMNVPIFSPFGMGLLVLRPIESATQAVGQWLVEEVQTLYLPHPPELLTQQFGKLLPHLTESVKDDKEIRDKQPPAVLDILSDLEPRQPSTYTDNAYLKLIRAKLLPDRAPWILIKGVADCTPKDDEVSNRTRWALQMLLIRFMMRYGEPSPTESFLYVWHDAAFQFAGGSRTIDKLAWKGINLTATVASVSPRLEKLAASAGCEAIHYTNQPDGTIPRVGVPVRIIIDVPSRLLYDR